MSKSKTFFELINNGLYPDCHSARPLSESVIVSSGWRRLVDNYINKDIGICLYVHTVSPTIDLKLGDLVFQFQKTVIRDSEIFKTSSFRNSELGVGPRVPSLSVHSVTAQCLRP